MFTPMQFGRGTFRITGGDFVHVSEHKDEVIHSGVNAVAVS